MSDCVAATVALKHRRLRGAAPRRQRVPDVLRKVHRAEQDEAGQALGPLQGRPDRQRRPHGEAEDRRPLRGHAAPDLLLPHQVRDLLARLLQLRQHLPVLAEDVKPGGAEAHGVACWRSWQDQRRLWQRPGEPVRQRLEHGPRLVQAVEQHEEGCGPPPGCQDQERPRRVGAAEVREVVLRRRALHRGAGPEAGRRRQPGRWGRRVRQGHVLADLGEHARVEGPERGGLLRRRCQWPVSEERAEAGDEAPESVRGRQAGARRQPGLRAVAQEQGHHGAVPAFDGVEEQRPATSARGVGVRPVLQQEVSLERVSSADGERQGRLPHLRLVPSGREPGAAGGQVQGPQLHGPRGGLALQLHVVTARLAVQPADEAVAAVQVRCAGKSPQAHAAALLDDMPEGAPLLLDDAGVPRQPPQRLGTGVPRTTRVGRAGPRRRRASSLRPPPATAAEHRYVDAVKHRILAARGAARPPPGHDAAQGVPKGACTAGHLPQQRAAAHPRACPPSVQSAS
mmetsp:Transcript_100160/g.312068  ORF Transcript_100160/g.312068 Transcript_100160/m.312068 type:complete len:510 (-) Transcript_100160:144-1673(-)